MAPSKPLLRRDELRAGGEGLQLGADGLMHANVARWSAIAGKVSNIVVYSCGAATMTALHIAAWSGPRNISTAMMRAWENRADCVVSDEPLYAHYLQATGLDHPARDQVIAAGDTDWRRVVTTLTSGVHTWCSEWPCGCVFTFALLCAAPDVFWLFEFR